MSRTALAVLVVFVSAWGVPAARAQSFGERGFIQAGGFFFPDTTQKDPTQVVGDVLVRDEGFVKPANWLQFAAGLDFRANTHDQVDSSWSPDFSDRGTLRPRLSVRRLNATITHGPLTLDLGKQFIRWGKTDIVTPTDRFAPRDFINVTDNDVLPGTGARGVFQWKANTGDAVWYRSLRRAGSRFSTSGGRRSALPRRLRSWTAAPCFQADWNRTFDGPMRGAATSSLRRISTDSITCRTSRRNRSSRPTACPSPPRSSGPTPRCACTA
jgi:hypothetical protein